MKRLLLMIICVMSFCGLSAQSHHKIAFYNVENFFDTIDDPNTNDDEFTPNGSNEWTYVKYAKKLTNVERVLFDISKIESEYPAVIGFAEVEVSSVMEDIASTPKLAPAKYQVVHYDSPERRGVDVAFLYRPDVFQLEGSEAIRSVIPGRPDFKTRDILTMWGKIDKEPFFFAVVHWSSRVGGQKSSEHLRIANATQLRSVVDSVSMANPATKIVLMGDFNDDPQDKSLYEVLGATESRERIKNGDFFNPFYSMHKAGYGTLGYAGRWNLFDNIVVSKNLVFAEPSTYKIDKSPLNSKYYGTVFKTKYLLQQSGSYKGYPYRSYSNGAFIGGYSDHLPVFITISRTK
ncbi:MAG: endonuclease/exonuclease/phosphatase family protein [Rikenellaceae bacterium]